MCLDLYPVSIKMIDESSEKKPWSQLVKHLPFDIPSEADLSPKRGSRGSEKRDDSQSISTENREECQRFPIDSRQTIETTLTFDCSCYEMWVPGNQQVFPQL
jgi:hypothetical protein